MLVATGIKSGPAGRPQHGLARLGVLLVVMGKN
jgi:hypothetical protein